MREEEEARRIVAEKLSEAEGEAEDEAREMIKRARSILEGY